MPPQRTVIHLVRHGEVLNPAGVLGRLPDYHLSDVGREMAERGLVTWASDIVHLRCSPRTRPGDHGAARGYVGPLGHH